MAKTNQGKRAPQKVATDDRNLIDLLGGVASLSAELALSKDDKRVAMWNTRNTIAYAWRHEVAEIAKKKRVALPEGFFNRPMRAAVSA